jgi:hypothetical protein
MKIRGYIFYHFKQIKTSEFTLKTYYFFCLEYLLLLNFGKCKYFVDTIDERQAKR